MKHMWLVPFILLGMLLAGCSGQPIDYQSGDNMEGPGLFTQDSPYASDEGFRIYSDDPNQPSLVGSERAKAQAGESNTSSDYQQRKEFEAYQQFRNLPKDSPEYKQFEQWLQWKHYQTWTARQKQSKQQ